jgi:hypothetical protein
MTRDADHRAARASDFWHYNRKGAGKKRIWRKLHKGARQQAKAQINAEREDR